MPSTPKYTLAIETATQKGSLSLLENEEELGFWIGDNAQALSAALLPNISELLSRHDLKVKDLALIAVSAGPGSFTGVRVGLSVAQGLKTALDLPAVAVPLPEALAMSVKDAEKVIAVIPAGRDEVYCQGFELTGGIPVALSPITPILFMEMIESREVENALLVTTPDLKPEYLQILESREMKSRVAHANIAKYIGASAIMRHLSGKENKTLSPIYVKEFGL
jgi:tRNA threonylcarbamoyl adenosine modification protein YeaZ